MEQHLLLATQIIQSLS